MTTEAQVIRALENTEKTLKRKFPRVFRSLRYVFRSNSSGDDAVFVRVVLRDREGDYRLKDVKPIADTIRAAVRATGAELFPYVRYMRESDEAEMAGVGAY